MKFPFCDFTDDSLAKVVLENEHCLFMQYYNGIPEGSELIIPIVLCMFSGRKNAKHYFY